MRRIGLTSLIIVTTFSLAGADQGQAQQLSPSDRAFWVASGAAFAGGWLLDEELRREPPAQRAGTPGRLALIGDEIAVRRNVVPALFTAIVIAELMEWPADSERFVRLSAGVAASQFATSLVKMGLGRGRPRTAGEPLTFRPLTNDNEWQSLPSGHASSAFSIAAGLAAEFDLPLPAEALAYALATLSAWSRVYDDAHWTSDVVAGAVLGIAGARTTVRWLQRRSESDEGAAAGEGGGGGVPVVLLRVRLP